MAEFTTCVVGELEASKLSQQRLSSKGASCAGIMNEEDLQRGLSWVRTMRRQIDAEIAYGRHFS